MAEGGGIGGGLELERELTCAICTEILYQPLTLLDCLHTFCGYCLKGWFRHQASTASQSRRVTSIYTCPSCRESVRSTKADWRLTTLLEGYLKANTDKARTEEQKTEMRQFYKPGENVIPPVRRAREDDDSEDERVLAAVREMSMADVDPETARRRAERATRHRRRHEDARSHQQHSPEELRRRQEPSSWAAQQAQLTESRLREHDGEEVRIEHQPSLRSLLSASDADSHDVQAEILRSIYAEGVLDGLDLDNLTIEQEEELTDRIAEAYRRRQRHRDRSGDRERRHRPSRSPQSSATAPGVRSQQATQADATSGQQHSPRSRPPVSTQHLYEPGMRNQRRSASSTSQRGDRSTHSDGPGIATRSVTDLPQPSDAGDTHRDPRERLSSSGRSVTDPQGGNIREQIHRLRAESNNATAVRSNLDGSLQSSGSQFPITALRDATPRNVSSTSLPRSPPGSNVQPDNSVRPVVSTAAFAPEAVSDIAHARSVPSIKCERCSRPEIQYELHYNCPHCLEGAFNLCLRCYRTGRGCNHWFGFGFRAFERWHRNAPPSGVPNSLEEPHILTPQRYMKRKDVLRDSNSFAGDDRVILQEGAFCESCFAFANDSYWYCNLCLEGAWGFCDKCVNKGRHCTHSLLLVAHTGAPQQTHDDPTKASLVGLPHLRQGNYATLPVITHCDICHRSIPPNDPRLHCYQCNNGDYDICNECYQDLVSQGKINEANGSNGWRRCLKGHRMAIIKYQFTRDGDHLRATVGEPIGGRAFKEDEVSLSSRIPASGLPPEGGVGMRCLAIYNYFPTEGVADELAFPKNAEIREVEDKNGDWFWGVYAGAINLFPSNHVRVL